MKKKKPASKETLTFKEEPFDACGLIESKKYISIYVKNVEGKEASFILPTWEEFIALQDKVKWHERVLFFLSLSAGFFFIWVILRILFRAFSAV